MFGGYDVQTKSAFCVEVPNRQGSTLMPLIRQFVLPGSTIHTDSAPVYNQLTSWGYIHKKFNHFVGEFVNRSSVATTNHVEAMWSRAKRDHKNQNGTHRTTLQSHLWDLYGVINKKTVLIDL